MPGIIGQNNMRTPAEGQSRRHFDTNGAAACFLFCAFDMHCITLETTGRESETERTDDVLQKREARKRVAVI